MKNGLEQAGSPNGERDVAKRSLSNTQLRYITSKSIERHAAGKLVNEVRQRKKKNLLQWLLGRF